jgi:hypothetical protein
MLGTSLAVRRPEWAHRGDHTLRSPWMVRESREPGGCGACGGPSGAIDTAPSLQLRTAGDRNMGITGRRRVRAHWPDLFLSCVSRRRRSIIPPPIGTSINREAPVAPLGRPHALTKGRRQVSRRRADGRRCPSPRVIQVRELYLDSMLAVETGLSARPRTRSHHQTGQHMGSRLSCRACPEERSMRTQEPSALRRKSRMTRFLRAITPFLWHTGRSSRHEASIKAVRKPPSRYVRAPTTLGW